MANVEFVKGYLEDMPLADATVDVVISNCVINLSGDKPRTIAEAARVLRPGGRFTISDVIADPDMDEQTKVDMAAWTGCVAGALTETEFRAILSTAGFDEIEIRPTHRVHEHAASAIIRARKPDAAGCCGTKAHTDSDSESSLPIRGPGAVARPTDDPWCLPERPLQLEQARLRRSPGGAQCSRGSATPLGRRMV